MSREVGHHHFKHAEKPGLVTVPHPKRDLPIGTWNSILKDAGLKQGEGQCRHSDNLPGGICF
ncbi:type II toxin-antitoxin system HicA family toxin [Rugamonas sp. CCM 8940]|nr:type II toxin-antitoxin system HicA family toxin [Rugamonas sp. CCM 8940]